jgi:hypothetical protein
LGDFFEKNAHKSFGQYFSEKNAPNAKKYHPNGKISSNLVTLKASFSARVTRLGEFGRLVDFFRWAVFRKLQKEAKLGDPISTEDVIVIY